MNLIRKMCWYIQALLILDICPHRWLNPALCRQCKSELTDFIQSEAEHEVA